MPAGQSHSSHSRGGGRGLLSVLLPLMWTLHVAVTEQPDIVGVNGASSYCTAFHKTLLFDV